MYNFLLTINKKIIMIENNIKTRTFKHLTFQDRQIIFHMRFVEKKTLQEIANIVGKSKSTISSEISRNKVKNQYIPNISHKIYKNKLHKKDSYKIDSNPKIYNYILKRLKNDKWSPDVISVMMKQDIGLSISAETIYNYIYNSSKSISLGLYKLLPSRNIIRIKYGSRKKRAAIPNRTSIHKRSPVADERKEIGHFEGDLTFDKGNQSKNIGVIVDKKSQKAFLMINNSKRKNTVTYGFANKINSIPKNLRKTIAFDNGKEFVSHTTYRLQGFKTYFCDAYSPWQKGLVEKINSMIHRIFPKKLNINLLTKDLLKKIENILNNMPRKILGYKTPNQA
jgi:IS30 family transposase